MLFSKFGITCGSPQVRQLKAEDYQSIYFHTHRKKIIFHLETHKNIIILVFFSVLAVVFSSYHSMASHIGDHIIDLLSAIEYGSMKYVRKALDQGILSSSCTLCLILSLISINNSQPFFFFWSSLIWMVLVHVPPAMNMVLQNYYHYFIIMSLGSSCMYVGGG